MVNGLSRLRCATTCTYVHIYSSWGSCPCCRRDEEVQMRAPYAYQEPNAPTPSCPSAPLLGLWSSQYYERRPGFVRPGQGPSEQEEVHPPCTAFDCRPLRFPVEGGSRRRKPRWMSTSRHPMGDRGQRHIEEEEGQGGGKRHYPISAGRATQWIPRSQNPALCKYIAPKGSTPAPTCRPK